MMPRIRRIVYLLTFEKDVYRKSKIRREDLIRDAWRKTADVYERWEKGRNDPKNPIKGPFWGYCDTALWRELRDAMEGGVWEAVHFKDAEVLERTVGVGEEQILDEVQQGWNKARIGRARSHLSPDEQALLDDFLANGGEPPRKMAKRLNMPVSQVYALQKRTFRKLRGLLEKPKLPDPA